MRHSAGHGLFWEGASDAYHAMYDIRCKGLVKTPSQIHKVPCDDLVYTVVDAGATESC